MTVDALSRLSTKQVDDWDFDDDLPVYAAADYLNKPNEHDMNEQKL